MPAVLAQSLEAGPHQRSLGHHFLQLPHPATQNLPTLPPPNTILATAYAGTPPRSQIPVPVSPKHKSSLLALSDYSHSLYSYHSPHPSTGGTISPLYLVQPTKASLPPLPPNPASAVLSPVPSKSTSPASPVDMDRRLFTRRPDDPIEDIEWVCWLST
jgi:hypothetical protein